MKINRFSLVLQKILSLFFIYLIIVSICGFAAPKYERSELTYIIEATKISSNTTVIKNKESNKYGLIDSYGNTLAEPIFDKIAIDKKNSFAIMYDGNFKSLYFYNDNKMFPEQFKEILYLNNYSFLCLSRENVYEIIIDKYNIRPINVNFNGYDVFAQYSLWGQPSYCGDDLGNGLYVYSDYNNDGSLNLGLIDNNGIIKIKADNTYSSIVMEDNAVLMNHNYDTEIADKNCNIKIKLYSGNTRIGEFVKQIHSNRVIVNSSAGFKVLDMENNTVISYGKKAKTANGEDMMMYSLYDGYIYSYILDNDNEDSDGRLGLFNIDGKELLPCIYREITVEGDTVKVKPEHDSPYSIINLHDLEMQKIQASASLPDFDIVLNGKHIDNNYRLYPFIAYNDITYFPMTYYDSRFLNIDTHWDEKSGLSIIKGADISADSPDTSTGDNAITFNAFIADFDINVNGKKIYNYNGEPYPLLVYRGVTYFPLTWRFCVDEFGWDYHYSDDDGLVINSK